MEKKLSKLFDYQRFEGNKELQGVIDTVRAKYQTREVSLDELEMVSAAGTPMVPGKKKEEER